MGGLEGIPPREKLPLIKTTMKTNNKDKMIEEFWTALRNHTMWRDSANGLIEDRITELLAEALTKHEEAIIQKDIERLEWMKTKLISKLGTHTTFELEDKIEILQTLIDIKRK